jgi:hypothetical protein
VGRKADSPPKDQIAALSYIGKSGWQNSFGGNLLIDNALQRKTGQKEAGKVRRQLENIFANLRKLLEINNIFFRTCPGLCVGDRKNFDLFSTVRLAR